VFLYHLHFLWRISALNEIDNDRIDWTDISLNLKGLDTNVIHDTLMDLQQTQEETEDAWIFTSNLYGRVLICLCK
jgi:hypothetical protein